MIDKNELKQLVSHLKNFKVLLVEDNEESRNQALKMLKNYFSVIDVALDGEDGLERYKNYLLNTNSCYDVVISDIQMPRMNGIDMSKAIYKINKEQKIIIISAYSDKEYLIELISIGVDGFIQKPLFFEQILDALTQVSRSLKENSIVTLAKNCTYDKLSKEFHCDGEKIIITKNENMFIEFLINNYKSASSMEEVFNYIFYDKPEKDFSTDSIKGLVKRLRKKVPDGLILYNRDTGYSIDMDF